MKPEADTAVVCLISVCGSWKQGNWNLCLSTQFMVPVPLSAAKLHIFTFIMDTEGQ